MKSSRVRYPNRRQRRWAFRTSSLQNMMAWGPFHKTRLEGYKELIFKANPLMEWLTSKKAVNENE